MPLFNSDDLRRQIEGTSGTSAKENTFHYTLENKRLAALLDLVPKAKHDEFIENFVAGQPTLSLSTVDEDGDPIEYGKQKERQVAFQRWQLYDRDPQDAEALTILREAENRNRNKRQSGYLGLIPGKMFKVFCLAYRMTLGIAEKEETESIPAGKGAAKASGREVTPS